MNRLFLLLLALSSFGCRTKDDTGTPGDACTWYTDADADGYGDPAGSITAPCDAAPSGTTDRAGDCDDGDALVYPGAAELCDGLDDDCDGEVDEDAVDAGVWYADADGDGYGDPLTAIAACAAPSGAVGNGDDCEDSDDQVHPDAPERCDQIDNDCDGEVDEDLRLTWYADADRDGYGDPALSIESCDPGEGWVDDDTDCDDDDPDVSPSATEVCNDVDDDCDGSVDEDLESTWYADADGDGYGDPAAALLDCEPGAGWVDDDTDCDDADASVNPAAPETCDGVDDDCDGLTDDADPDVTGTSTWYADADSDGYGDDATVVAACAAPSGYTALAGDCDDGDSAYNPGAVEGDCTDPADYNCDGSVGWADDDADGFAACEDCDDGDAAVHPLADETCNGTDDDCDGTVDEPDAVDATAWYADADGDAYGDPAVSTTACAAPAGYVAPAYATDCDDGDPAINPVAAEACNGADDDCDGSTDEGLLGTWYADGDGDGFGDPATAVTACTAPSGSTADATDCDDGDAAINPAADEACNGADDDCDGTTDEPGAIDAPSWYRDGDGDGYGASAAATRACTQPSGYVSDDGDCEDTDAALNPTTVWYLDHDGDGYGDPGFTLTACVQPAHYVDDATDCDDLASTTNPGATEICDGIDQDCDGDVDEGYPSGMTTWYADVDADGYGDPASTTDACSEPTGYTDDATDCDDTDPDVNPAGTEVCNGLDDDCDGSIDPDAVTCGAAAACAAISCEDILTERPDAEDGVYYLDPELSGTALEAWCEMDFSGGGWLAVYNMMEGVGDPTGAAAMHASLIINDDMDAAVQPDSTSDAIYTANLPLEDYTEVVYGWAASSTDDVTRYGTYSDSAGLAGECYLDGYCGADVAVATFDIEPTGSSRTIYTGNSPSYPHVGLGFSGQIITWGYDNNDSSYGHWANWYDLNPCCTAGNTSEVLTPGWRYVIYIR